MSKKVKWIDKKTAIIIFLAFLLFVDFLYIGPLMEERDKLKKDYSTLKSNYDSLSFNYTSLLKRYNELTAIILNNESLKVTSRLIPKTLLGILYAYDVEVTVTNIGNKPFKMVWIIIFPYVDGELKFDKYSHIKNFEGLYMGESYSCTFTWLSSHLTTYRVLVIGG